GLRFVTGMAELEAHCAAASVVVSARYHGCIGALLAGVPCLGLGPGKSLTLFEGLGAADRFLPHCGPLDGLLETPPPALDLAAFGPLRDATEASLAYLGALMEALPRRRSA